MDEENNDINRFNTVLGVEEDKSAGSIIKNFVKKIGKVPREVPITYRANFNKANKEFSKNLRKWDMIEEIRTRKSLGRYLLGNKHKLIATKKLFADLERAARKSNQKYNGILNDLLGNDRDKNKGNPFDYNGKIGKAKIDHDENMQSRKQLQAEINELTEKYNTLLAKQDKIGLNTQEADIINKMEDTRKKLAELEKQRNDVSSKVFDSVQPMKIMDTDSKVVMERNKELSKLAAGLYDRSGKKDDSLFKVLEKELAASMKVDQEALDKVKAELKSMYGKKGGLSNKLAKLENKPRTEETDNAIAELKSQITKAENTIKKLTRDRKIAEGYVNLDKQQQAQYKHYYDNRDKPQDFGKDKNYKTEEFAPKFDAMMRKKTSAIKGMVDSIGALSTPKFLEDINKDITKTYESLDRLQIKMQEITSKQSENSVNISNGDTETTITQQIKQAREEIEKKKKILQEERQEGKKIVSIYGKLADEARKASRELKLLKDDMNIDPIRVQLESSDLKKYNDTASDIKHNVLGIGRNWRKSNVLTRLASRILLNIRSQIADMINPLTLFRRGWDAWINRFDNLPWKNTFEVIGYNMVTAFEPVFKWLATALIKIAQFFNPLFKRLAGVDLFDKSAWSMEKIKKGMGQLTASFDELHSNNENPNEFNTAFDLGQIEPLSPKWQEAAEKFAEGFEKVWNGVINFVKEHPIASAIMGGAALLLGPKALGGLLVGAGKLIGKGVVGLGKLAWNGLKWVGPKIWNGVKWVAGKVTDPSTWNTVGTFFKNTGTKITGFMNKGLYTGMNGATVTMGKFLGGATMVAGGVALAGKSAFDAGKNWQDYNNTQKAVKVGGVALGSTLAGIGAVMLGASGPVGWAIGGAVALGALTVGMFQVQDGIKSVKKEQEAWTKAQENLAMAEENLNAATYNYSSSLAQLEELERQTGLSGEALYNSVKNGTLTIDQMNSAQLQVYNSYVQTKDALKQYTTAIEQHKQAEKDEAEGMIRTALAARKKKDDYVDAKNAILKAVEEEKISTEEAAEYFSRLMGNMKKDAREALMEEIPEDIRQCVEPTKYASGWEKFGIGWNNFWSGVWEGTKTFISNIGTSIHDGWENMKTNAATAWENIKTNVSGKWNELKTNAANTWENMKTKAAEKWEEVKNSAIGKKVQEIATTTKNKWEELKTNTQTRFQEIANEARDKWETAKNNISQKANDAFTQARDKWNELKTNTETIFGDILTTAHQKFSDIATTIGNKAKEAFDTAKSWFDGIAQKAKEAWESVKNWGAKIGDAWNSGDTFGSKLGNATKAAFGINSYDVGTNYVPNDQLAMVHKGEAIIPAKYNKPYTPTSSSSGLESTVAAMTQEIANLRGLIQGGIPVKGEFKQRGQDLVAVVEKGRNKNGNQALSNPAYAR